jgi:molybdenum cofactor biosynthesis enzyme MoaA
LIEDNFDQVLCKLNSIDTQTHNQKKINKTSVIDQSTTVIDITYMCNSHCRYCQWGNIKNPRKRHLAIEDILLPPEVINALGTTRIVLSGGEPRLYPDLSRIISYYKKIVSSVVLITNGYNFTKQEVDTLASHGLTGLAVSLDSTNPKESELTRGTSPGAHRRLISELRGIGGQKKGIELGINCVVSSVTGNWKTVRNLLKFGKEVNANYIKFQPIFDDGYVGKKAPDLKLNSSHYGDLYKISANLNSFDHPLTNPPEFWENIADLTMGKLLEPETCNQRENSIYVNNNLSVCYWLPNVTYNGEHKRVTRERIDEKRRLFEIAKTNCRVDYHCFCLQNLSHVWNKSRKAVNNES